MRSTPASSRPTPVSYHGVEPEKIDWSSVEPPTRAVREYLDALDIAEEPEPGRKAAKVISLSDPASAWTAKANKRVQFGYGLNYLIDNEHAIIVDVEPTPARTFDEVRATAIMLDRTKARLGIKPKRLAADTAYGTGKFLGWLGRPGGRTAHSASLERDAGMRLLFFDFRSSDTAAPCRPDLRVCGQSCLPSHLAASTSTSRLPFTRDDKSGMVRPHDVL